MMIKESNKHQHAYSLDLKISKPVTTQYPWFLNIVLGTSCFLLMFQLYFIAPLIPGYFNEFNSTLLEMSIPAFAIPFAFAAAGMVLFPSTIKKPDKWFSLSLLAMSLGSAALSTVKSAEVFLLCRVLTGLGTGTMLPAALIIATRSVDKKKSFINMIAIILYLATGMTFAPSIGGWLNESVGWRYLYQVTGILTAGIWFLYTLFINKNHAHNYRQQYMVKGLSGLQLIRKGKNIYSFVFLSGVFHSGLFVWISYYFTTQYKLNENEIATALLILGLPGYIATLLMLRYHLDAKVIRILYSGLALTIAALFTMMLNVPLWLAECLLAVMSIGYCFTQPLFIGILKLPLGGISAGRLIAVGSGILFAGYGTGPLMMAALINANKDFAIGFFVFLVITMGVLSRKIWRVK